VRLSLRNLRLVSLRSNSKRTSNDKIQSFKLFCYSEQIERSWMARQLLWFRPLREIVRKARLETFAKEVSGLFPMGGAMRDFISRAGHEYNLVWSNNVSGMQTWLMFLYGSVTGFIALVALFQGVNHCENVG